MTYDEWLAEFSRRDAAVRGFAKLRELVHVIWMESDAQPGEGSPEEAAADAALDVETGLEAAVSALAEVEVSPIRPWIFRDPVSGVTEVQAPCTLSDARRAARAWGREGHDPTDRTFWVEVQILDPVRMHTSGGEIRASHVEDVQVAIDPATPPCGPRHARRETHAWRDDGMSGFGAVLTGHGGGVITRQRCAHCGIRRVVDTWAQNLATGEQGLTATRYETEDGEPLGVPS